MLRLEARNSQTPIERKPPWIKTRLRTGPHYSELKQLVRSEGLHTVCEEAGCPNIFECWEDREATFLIGGDKCTRRCDFCQIATGKPGPLDADEPRRVAESVATMGSLEVITRARQAGLITKSNLILGMGEERHEVSEAMADLRAAGCDLLTITQYLRPSVRHHPVERWLPPQEFDELGAEARELGFAGVMAGPLVRSSYRAGRLYRQAADRLAAVRQAAGSS